MSDRKIVDYHLTSNKYLSFLCDNVKCYIRSGWQPYGYPFETKGINNHVHVGDDVDCTMFTQAMVKYGEHAHTDKKCTCGSVSYDNGVKYAMCPCGVKHHVG